MLANFGTNSTGIEMQVRSPQHEVGTGLANLCAIQQEPDMVRLSMLTAHLQAMHRCFYTNVVTALALLDAFFHLLRDRGVAHSLHDRSPFII